MMIEQKLNRFVIAGIGIILIILFFFLGYFISRQIVIKEKNQETAKIIAIKNQEIADLKARIKNIFPGPPAELFSINGLIKEIGANFIIVEYIIPPDLPLLPYEQPKTELRKVLLTEKTKMVEFQLLFLISNQSSKPSSKKIIKLSDFKIGDRITAIAKENIKTKMGFEASEIQLQILPELPELPA